MDYLKITDNPNIKTSELIAKCREKFRVYCYWNDEQLNDNFPPPQKETTRYFKMEQEASDRKGESWNDMKDVRKDMMTLREYAIACIQYNEKTGKHLDEKRFTLLKDALPGGGVARGYWHAGSGCVEFYWGGADDCNPCIGARLAIPFSPNSPTSSFPAYAMRTIRDLPGCASGTVLSIHKDKPVSSLPGVFEVVEGKFTINE